MTYPRSRLLGVNLPRQTPELQLLDATLRMWVAGRTSSPQTDPRGRQRGAAFSPAPPTLPAKNPTTLTATRKGAGETCSVADT